MEKSGGVKRSAEVAEGEGLLDGVKSVLVEVDGVLTKSSYVKDTLLKYVTENVESYVTTHFTSDVITAIVSDLRKQALEDVKAEVVGAVAIPEGDVTEVASAVAASVKWQMTSGRFKAGVGRLMIEILRSAFKSNALQGCVLEDVPSGLKKLKEKDVKVHGYTSNCVELTKLQFEHSTDGDLSGLLADFRGAQLGSRVEKDTYAKLAIDLEMKPEEILYLTRSSIEATAAHSAGLKCCLVVREGNKPFTDKELETFQSISSLNELFPGGSDGQETSPPKKHRGGGDAAAATTPVKTATDTTPQKKTQQVHGDAKTGCEKKVACHAPSAKQEAK